MSAQGGPAFPHQDYLAAGWHGMTLRDYFIAHAPAEPQPWFTPSMPQAPKVPALHEAPQDVKTELQSTDYEDWLSEKDMSVAACAWHIARKTALSAAHVWAAESEKQRYVQWPAAWADAMLKTRLASDATPINPQASTVDREAGSSSNEQHAQE